MSHRSLRIGGWVPFSSVDHPGHLAAVVFVQGCPWRCGYCHNPHLQSRHHGASSKQRAWDQVLSWLEARRGLLDSVVFSGGEPLVDPCLPQAVMQVKALGFQVAMHTAGMYWDRLRKVSSQLDWVGLDIKASLDDDTDYDRVTGVAQSAWAVRQSLYVLRQSGVAFECRTTVHPSWSDTASLERTARSLAARGAPHWVIQRARAPQCHGALPVVDPDFPSPDLMERLRALLPSLSLR